MNEEDIKSVVSTDASKRDASALVDAAFMGIVTWDVRSQIKDQAVSEKKNQQPTGK